MEILLSCMVGSGIRAPWYRDRHEHTSEGLQWVGVINRSKQQVLPKCRLCTANYEALQVFPTQPTIKTHSNTSPFSFSHPSTFALSLHYVFSTFRSPPSLRIKKHSHGKCYQVIILLRQCISSVSPHLEPPAEQQQQESGENLWKGLLQKDGSENTAALQQSDWIHEEMPLKPPAGLISWWAVTTFSLVFHMFSAN